MRPTLFIPLVLALAAGCAADADGTLPGSSPGVLPAGTTPPASVCNPPPSPFTEQQLEQLCDDPEWEPTTPPDNGVCHIEVRLTKSTFVDGQGVSEGRGEISFSASADNLDDPTAPTHIANVATQIYNREQSYGQTVELGTYDVPVGTQQRVRVCVDGVEHDENGSNGDDDLASGCTTLLLQCSGADQNGDGVPDGAASIPGTIGPRPLCGDNQCNGSVSFDIEAMAADADMDGVENDEDFTPELCDEAEKGELGIGLVVYYHYGDPWFTSLFQGIGTGIAQMYTHYDYAILISDQDASNPANVNDAMFREADMVLSPTREGLLDAMQEMTSRGLRFDVMAFSHGHMEGDDDADFETTSGDAITGDWLIAATDPCEIGTARHGVPIVAWWSTTCIAARQIDAWIEIGALAASGSVDLQFNVNTSGNYTSNWFSGDDYQTSVDDSVTLTTVLAVETLIKQEGKGSPWLCRRDNPDTDEPNDGGGFVLEKNACAEGFFGVGPGANTAKYNIQAVYDTSVSGAANMQIASTRVFLGHPSITFGAPAWDWP
jgi:hypothetical protein